MYIYYNWSFLDVNQKLAVHFPKVTYDYKYIQLIDSTVTLLILPNWICNDINYTIFDFSRFSRVESIEIGDNSFRSVQAFKIDGLNRLKSLKIGKRSFTHKKSWFGKDKSKSFHILNCELLESIQIGEYSFRDFAGEFELKNLPNLASIKFQRHSFCKPWLLTLESIFE